MAEKAISLFRAVRELIYDPYRIRLVRREFKASVILMRGRGYSAAKAIVLAAAARAIGIPSRLGMADVKNHLSTERLRKVLKRNIYFHGYTELFLNGVWLKVTPAFNSGLCEKIGVRPLEFDGRSDCLMYEYDIYGNRQLEYLKHYGPFADVPFDMIVSKLQTYYPGVYASDGSVIGGDFAAEARDAHRDGHGNKEDE
jgi:transglutaminase-like putative cysteine protease